MKKSFKRISALLLAVVTCVCLCSCRAIKEMRASQAFYGENGEVTWGEQVYKPLDIQELPSGLEIESYDSGYITEKDVPVLLADSFGEWMTYNHNKTVIEAAGVYYAREDAYDYIADLVTFPYISDYCVEVEIEGSYDIEYQIVKQRYLNAIDEIIYGGNEIVIGMEENYYGVWADDVSIYKCDEKMVFQSIIYRIEEKENGDMYLTRFTGAYGASTIAYRVPDDKKAMMKELLTLGEDGLR